MPENSTKDNDIETALNENPKALIKALKAKLRERLAENEKAEANKAGINMDMIKLRHHIRLLHIIENNMRKEDYLSTKPSFRHYIIEMQKWQNKQEINTHNKQEKNKQKTADKEPIPDKAIPDEEPIPDVKLSSLLNIMTREELELFVAENAETPWQSFWRHAKKEAGSWNSKLFSMAAANAAINGLCNILTVAASGLEIIPGVQMVVQPIKQITSTAAYMSWGAQIANDEKNDPTMDKKRAEDVRSVIKKIVDSDKPAAATGGIGAALVAISFIPGVGPIAAFIGCVSLVTSNILWTNRVREDYKKNFNKEITSGNTDVKYKFRKSAAKSYLRYSYSSTLASVATLAAAAAAVVALAFPPVAIAAAGVAIILGVAAAATGCIGSGFMANYKYNKYLAEGGKEGRWQWLKHVGKQFGKKLVSTFKSKPKQVKEIPAVELSPDLQIISRQQSTDLETEKLGTQKAIKTIANLADKDSDHDQDIDDHEDVNATVDLDAAAKVDVATAAEVDSATLREGNAISRNISLGQNRSSVEDTTPMQDTIPLRNTVLDQGIPTVQNPPFGQTQIHTHSQTQTHSPTQADSLKQLKREAQSVSENFQDGNKDSSFAQPAALQFGNDMSSKKHNSPEITVSIAVTQNATNEPPVEAPLPAVPITQPPKTFKR